MCAVDERCSELYPPLISLGQFQFTCAIMSAMVAPRPDLSQSMQLRAAAARASMWMTRLVAVACRQRAHANTTVFAFEPRGEWIARA